MLFRSQLRKYRVRRKTIIPGLPVVLPIPLILPMIWANTSRMMTCGLPWPMPWTTSLEIARTAIFSKFSNATGSRWHFLTTILCPFDGYLFVSGRKKTATAKRQLRSYESNILFHVLHAEPGAYLSPSFHLRPKIAPPLICSDLEYRSIVA